VLAPAASAEDRADEAGHAEHVDAPPRLDGAALDLAGLPVEGVDAAHVGVHVGEYLAALAARAAQHAGLAGDDLVGLGRGLERAARHHQPERVEAGRVEHRQAAERTSELQEQLSVPGADEADAVHDIGAALRADVRDAPLVVDDANAAVGRTDAAGRALAAGAEDVGLVEPVDVARADAVEERRQAVVQTDLIGRFVSRRQTAEVAGREDAASRVGIVLGCDCGGCDRGCCCDGQGKGYVCAGGTQGGWTVRPASFPSQVGNGALNTFR
jgi:hypothetical protein